MPNDKWRKWLDSGSRLACSEYYKRKQRRSANAAMRALGVKIPRQLFVHHVHLTKIPLPATAQEFKGLLRGTNGAWLYSRRKARALVEADRAAGGSGKLMSFEYQRCLVCERALVGREASDYRERRRWPRYRCYWPWGPQCNASCKPNEKRAAEAIAMGLTRYERNREEWSA